MVYQNRLIIAENGHEYTISTVKGPDACNMLLVLGLHTQCTLESLNFFLPMICRDFLPTPPSKARVTDS